MNINSATKSNAVYRNHIGKFLTYKYRNDTAE